MRALNILSTASACITLCSCFGGGIVHGKRKVYENFSIQESTRPIYKVSESTPFTTNPTKLEIKKKWGSPSESKVEKRQEIWTYHTDTAFVGVVPMVGVGVPILVPTGRNGIDIYFMRSSDKATKAISRYTSWSGGYYGPPDESGTSPSGWQKLQD